MVSSNRKIGTFSAANTMKSSRAEPSSRSDVLFLGCKGVGLPIVLASPRFDGVAQYCIQSAQERGKEIFRHKLEDYQQLAGVRSYIVANASAGNCLPFVQYHNFRSAKLPPNPHPHWNATFIPVKKSVSSDKMNHYHFCH